MEHEEELFPMGVVARLTGIPADTIRVWERRYEAVIPHRTPKNARRYSSTHVTRLRSLKRLSDDGHRIGDIARLTDADLAELEVKTERPIRDNVSLINEYLAFVRDYDARGASRFLSRVARVTPSVELVFDFLAPVLRTVGEQWKEGELNIAHEHIVSAQIRSLVGTLLTQSDPPAGAPRLIIATPPGHRHEFGLLIGALIASIRGMEPFYLGPDMPWDVLLDVIDKTGANYCLLSVARHLEEGEQKSFASGLACIAESCQVWLGMDAGNELAESTSGVAIFHDYSSLDAAVMRAV